MSLSRVIRKARKRAWTLNRMRARAIRVGGREYHVRGFFESPLMVREDYEPYMRSPYRAALATRPGAFVDVGANAGQTLGTVLSVGPDRTWIGFEPQLDCCHAINTFILDNDLAGHTIHPFGLSDRQQTVRLLKRNASADKTASIVAGFRPDDFYTASQVVHTLVGDDVLLPLDTPIAVVKIDVEGAELDVLRGIVGVLETHRPVVFFEVLGNHLAVTRTDLDDATVRFRQERREAMEELLRARGYRLFRVGSPLVELDALEAPPAGGPKSTNIVAIHDDHVATYEAEL
jgi:FkbM family methyltransferase